MNTQRNMIAAMSLCAAAVPGLSLGALIDRGGGLIYDTDLNITWLANANYGAGTTYDTADGYNDGNLTWQNAMDWAENLSYHDSVRGVFYEDWRLPTTMQPDLSCRDNRDAGGTIGVQSDGYDCAGSELGHLFYGKLGGVAAESIETTHNDNYDLFTNAFGQYWSATESAINTAGAWDFFFAVGSQGTGYKTESKYAWAVRDGDVYAASTVPVPAAAWLFASGLLGLIGFAKRQ